MFRLAVLLFISISPLFSESLNKSYLVVFEESKVQSLQINKEVIQQRKSELREKMSSVFSGIGLLSKIQEEDQLWISLSVRLDLTMEQVQNLRSNSSVVSVIEDEMVMLDLPVEKSDIVPQGAVTYGLESLEVPEVWEKYGYRGEGVTVGVIDTGWADHNDLRGKVLRSKDFISKFEENEPNDDQGHGTHCMGTIGGGDKSGKAIGVAPNVKFIVAKIFNAKGQSSRSAILKAMQWITDPDGNPSTADFPRVISNSWGKRYEGFEKEMQYRRATQVWRDLGIAPVFAAGNSGPSKHTVSSPGALDSTLAVAAVDDKDVAASFSSRGPVRWENGVLLEKPDVAAPGVKVYSASHKGGYVAFSGTSMACPHVAGVVALMLQANPDLTVDEIFSILRQSAAELGEPGWDPTYGHGKISALKAVEIAQNLGYLNAKVVSQGAPVRVTVVQTGQVYRFDSGESIKLHLLAGSYDLLIQSFGAVDQSLSVEVAKGELSNLEISLEKAATVSWRIHVVNQDGEPLAARISFPEIPMEDKQIEKGGSAIELPAASYEYELKAFGYARQMASINLAEDLETRIEMIALKDLLIVNSTKDETLSGFIKSSIPRDYKFDYTNKYRNITLEDLRAYRRVLWYTGNRKKGALQYTRRNMLQDFFEEGGTVIVTGQDIKDNVGYSKFPERVFGIKIKRTKSRQERMMGLGLSLVINQDSSAKNQNSPEEIEVESEDAQLLLSWLNKRGAVSERVSGAGKAYYLGFGIEGLSRSDRTRLMSIIMERSEPTLSEELDRARLAISEGKRLQILRALEGRDFSGQSDLAQSLKWLESMNYSDSKLYKKIDSAIRFQEVHQ